jgi:hypothetical protein
LCSLPRHAAYPIGRRTIRCALLIAALAVIWNVLGANTQSVGIRKIASTVLANDGLAQDMYFRTLPSRRSSHDSPSAACQGRGDGINANRRSFSRLFRSLEHCAAASSARFLTKKKSDSFAP